MKRKALLASILFICLLFSASTSWALDQIVEKKMFFINELTLESGEKISPVKIGYETYGSLAPTKDNVILICHYYSGTSHAAGKYSAKDPNQDTGMLLLAQGSPLIRINILS